MVSISEGYNLDEGDSLTNTLIRSVGPDVAGMVITEFRRGWEMEKVLARKRQTEIAKSVQRLGRYTIDGVGQHTHEVDLFAYMYWHARTNGQCWKDPSFWNEYGRDNPATRVTYAARNTTVLIRDKSWLPKVKPRVELTGFDN